MIMMSRMRFLGAVGSIMTVLSLVLSFDGFSGS